MYGTYEKHVIAINVRKIYIALQVDLICLHLPLLKGNGYLNSRLIVAGIPMQIFKDPLILKGYSVRYAVEYTHTHTHKTHTHKHKDLHTHIHTHTHETYTHML